MSTSNRTLVTNRRVALLFFRLTSFKVGSAISTKSYITSIMGSESNKPDAKGEGKTEKSPVLASSSTSVDTTDVKDPPPAYTELQTAVQDISEPTSSSALTTLNTSQHFSQVPPVGNCLAHLRLLHSFQALKEDVGYTDGLWGLWDTLADGDSTRWAGIQANLSEKDKSRLTDDDSVRRMRLSKVREKRWAIYVARAADRYESWWQSVAGSDPPYLTTKEMNAGLDRVHTCLPESPITWKRMEWEEHMLPPLGECLR